MVLERTTVSNLHSFFVIDPKVLNSPSVTLGRLVTNVRTPWDEFCVEAPRPNEDQVGISPDALLRDLLEESSSAALKAKFITVLSTFLGTPDAENIAKSVAGKSYFLTNPRQWLKDVCQTSEVRGWIEEMIKIEWGVWLVVCIHTIPATSATSTANSDVKAQTNSNEEIMVAVQYRKVLFDWLESQDGITPRLEPGVNQWEPLILTKASTDDGQEPESDTLVVSLETHIDTAELDFSDEIFEEGDRILVL